MKKLLPLILVAVLMIFAVAQTSEALSLPYPTSKYPNGNYVEYWPDWYFDRYSHVVITYDESGGAYGIALTPDGRPDSDYDQIYLSTLGYFYYSSDGHTWYLY